MSRRPPAGVIAAVALALGMGLGVAAALTFLSPPAPGILERPNLAIRTPVTLQEFADPLPVDVRIGIAPPVALTPNRDGTLTTWACTPGLTLESGESSASVDGVPLLNLATPVPLWRDLDVGTEGADVAALQKELARLELPAHTDGVLSPTEVQSVAELTGAPGDGGVRRDRLLWLPAPAVTVQECAVGLGATVAAGQSIATVTAGARVAPVLLPEERIPGERLLDGFGEPLILGEDGALPYDLSEATIRESPAFQEASSGSPGAGAVTVRAQAVLAKPISAAAVPATAVLVTDEGTACVYASSKPSVVDVVGSEFGTSFVVFPDGEAPESVFSSVPEGQDSCE